MSELLDPRITTSSPLHCEKISKRYDGNTVLEDVSLTLVPGSILGLVGRNGAGKTTLIQILLGLYAVFEGSRWLGMVRRRLTAAPAFFTPRVAVICACKGAEAELEGNLLALCDFDYSGYEIFLSLASASAEE